MKSRFARRLVIVAASALASAGALAAPMAVNPLIERDGDGVVAAVRGLAVGGRHWDVRFVDGACAAVFGAAACRPGAALPFAFSSQAQASAASAALQQALAAAGAPTLHGCEGLDTRRVSCKALTPYAVDRNDSVEVMVASSSPTRKVAPEKVQTALDTGQVLKWTYAVWQPSPTVHAAAPTAGRAP